MADRLKRFADNWQSERMNRKSPGVPEAIRAAGAGPGERIPWVWKLLAAAFAVGVCGLLMWGTYLAWLNYKGLLG